MNKNDEELKELIVNRRYDEINLMTNVNYWSEVYIDAGIHKHIFLPRLKNELRRYSTYNNLSKDYYDDLWEDFIIFMNCYDDTGDIFEIANQLDDYVFIPLCVITMCNIFDMDCCIDEYLEYDIEFGTFEEDEVNPIELCFNVIDKDDLQEFFPKMTRRVMNILKYNDIANIRLCDITKKQFLKCRNAGLKSWTEFSELISEYK